MHLLAYLEVSNSFVDLKWKKIVKWGIFQLICVRLGEIFSCYVRRLCTSIDRLPALFMHPDGSSVRDDRYIGLLDLFNS
jgi:hypothetical protein